jgi:hypothetical protein
LVRQESNFSPIVNAKATKLPFKVRLCLEGVPLHTRQVATIYQLLPQGSLLEAINHDYRNQAHWEMSCRL